VKVLLQVSPDGRMSIHQKTLLGICLVGLSGSAMAQEHPVKMEDLPAAVQATGVSDSTLTGRQWGFAPRIGIAWSPSFVKNVVVRAGFGIYYDRGEFFSEFSPSAGGGFNGPFGVTLQPPFIVPVGLTHLVTKRS